MTSYCLPRMKELELILSPELKQFVVDHNIELINFSDIKKWPNSHFSFYHFLCTSSCVIDLITSQGLPAAIT